MNIRKKSNDGLQNCERVVLLVEGIASGINGFRWVADVVA